MPITYTDVDILELWDNAKAAGRTMAELAIEMGMSFKALDSRIYKARKNTQEAEGDKFTEDSKEKISVQDNGNHKTIISKSSRIKTVEQLKDRCEIDEEVWAETYANVETWEGYRRDEQKDLQFDEGKITGYVYDQGRLTIETLYKVEVKLVRRKPVALRPMVVPVSFETSYQVHRTEVHRPDWLKQTLVMGDPHFGFRRDPLSAKLNPFHDRDALSIALQVAAVMQPDRIVLGGDVLDLAEWSDRFARDPGMYFTTQPAVTEAAWWLTQLRGVCPDAEMDIEEGNHEARLRRLMMKHMITACDLTQVDDTSGFPVLSVPHLLKLDELGINYVGDYPNGKIWLSDTIVAVHGEKARAKSGATASAIAEEAQVDTIFFHIHRREMATRTLHLARGQRTVTAFTPGCLCRTDGTVPAAKSEMNWQKGLGDVEYDIDGRIPTKFNMIPIENNLAVWNGTIFEGESYVNQLNEDTEGKFNF